MATGLPCGTVTLLPSKFSLPSFFGSAAQDSRSASRYVLRYCWISLYVLIWQRKGANCLAFMHRYVYTPDSEAVLYTALCKGSNIKNTQIHYIIVSGIGTDLLVKTMALEVTILQGHKWTLNAAGLMHCTSQYYLHGCSLTWFCPSSGNHTIKPRRCLF